VSVRHGAVLPVALATMLLALAAIILLAGAPVAQAGSDVTVVVKNDLNNRTSDGYPKVALDRLSDRECWLDYDFEKGTDALAVAPGQQISIYSEVYQRNAPCAGNFKGHRQVALKIKESPTSSWVQMDGQTAFWLRFGRGSDYGTSSPRDCDPAAFGNNCFSISGFPTTWATRPSNVGLICLVLTRFTQNDKNSRAQSSTATISVRDDAQCNTPRASEYWPRINGVPITSGYPVMAGDTMNPSITSRAAVRADGDDDFNTGDPREGTRQMVANILTGSRFACEWGKTYTKDTDSPEECRTASMLDQYGLGALTVSGVPPAKFQILEQSATGNDFSPVGQNTISVPANGSPSTVTVAAVFQYGLTQTDTNTNSNALGQKSGFKWGFGWKSNLILGEVDTKNEISLEENYTHTWQRQKAWQTSTQEQRTQTLSTGAQPGRTTELRVYKTDLQTKFKYRADILFGVAKIEPVMSPAGVAMGMTDSVRQACAATVFGDDTVTGSFMEFAKRKHDLGARSPAANEDQREFLDSIDGMYIQGRNCPGFPAGFASQAGMKGTGVSTMTSNGRLLVPVLTPDGDQATDSNDKPIFQTRDAVGLRGCVFIAPYGNARSSRAPRTPTPTPRSAGDICASPDDNGNVKASASGTLVNLTSPAGASFASDDASASELVKPTPGDDVIKLGGGALDIVDPSPGADRIDGQGGFDVIDGGAGDDVINGGTGNFSLQGGTGNDQIRQTGGAGQIWGGTGQDTIITNGIRGGVEAGSGADTLRIGGATAGAVFAGGTGDDTYVIAPGVGCASVFELPGEGTDTVRTGRCVSGLGDIERIQLTGTAPVAISTGEDSQTIVGNDAANRLDGGNDVDRIDGGGGDDLIVLGADDFDTAIGGSGADRFVPLGTPSGLLGLQLSADAIAHRLPDFNPSEGDRIVLRRSVFGPQVAQPTSTWSIVRSASPNATVATPTLLVNTATGLVAFDRDGTGRANPKVIALLPVGTAVTPDIFLVR
jgi:Ca2+-binding RTX toxin-like protein